MASLIDPAWFDYDEPRRRGRTRFRFIARVHSVRGDYYLWQAHVPGDSRVAEITCRVDHFWARRP
jgi:hypothetical protein